MRITEAICSAVLLVVAVDSSRQLAQIPSYVIDYAPLVYLDVNEYYLPSDIGSQLKNTVPTLNFDNVTSSSSNLTLDNLSSLNQAGNCMFKGFGNCPIYLTSEPKESTYPSFFNGTLPDSKTGETEGATSCAVIVYDHGDGTVDAFYMYFYAFNLGDTVLGTLLGNHVGDWEHTMLRFVNGEPQTMWFSQHDSGETYTYDAVSKQQGRPIVYSGLGTHANYAVPGLHSRKIVIVTVNDFSSAGPLWDPIQNAYFYTFTPLAPLPTFNNGTFQAAAAPGLTKESDDPAPTDWLLFYGRWGDKQLPDSDPAQTNFRNYSVAWTWETGPTGPYNKDLNRNGTCPDSQQPCTTTTVLPEISGDPSPSTTIIRSTSTSTSKSTTETTSTTSTTTSHTSQTSSHTPTGTAGGGGNAAASQHGSNSKLIKALSTLFTYVLLT